MKTIYLKVEIPDTIPDPDLMVSARVKDTFDEWEELNFEEINLQTEGKRQWKTLSEYTVEVITDYILHSTHCGSKFEAQRAAKMYYDKIEKL